MRTGEILAGEDSAGLRTYLSGSVSSTAPVGCSYTYQRV